MTRPAAVTIGVFDGFHRGHAAVVRRAAERAREVRGDLVVFTFGTHPQLILGKEGAPPLLTTSQEKTALLLRAGAGTVRVLEFNRRLAGLTPRRFLAEHVFPHHRMAALVVGYDFAMGRDRSGSFPVLSRLGGRFGFTVERVAARVEGAEPVSSTRIRAALAAGDVALAGDLLGRPYSISGRVHSGDGRGSGLGFPTANLDAPRHKLWPVSGVYVCRVQGSGLDGAPAVVNVGTRPTVDGTAVSVEAHILDFEGDLVGRGLRVDFLHRLRDERKFIGVNELAAQIQADTEAGRLWLGKNVGSSSAS